MRTLLLSFTLFLYSFAFSQFSQTLVSDDFTDTSKFVDISKLLLWKARTEPTSGFVLSEKTDKNNLKYNAISLTTEAAANKKFNIPDGLRESTGFDYVLGDIDRTLGSLKLEFDVLWTKIDGGGQSDRIVVSLVHDYPEDGLKFGYIDSINIKAPFGRPSYNMRVFSRRPSGTNNYANVFYGGGKDTLGEFEKYNSTYWLPGFISGPSGISPESSAQFPTGPVHRYTSATAALDNEWVHFTWIVHPESMQIYSRASGGSGLGNKIMDMSTPDNSKPLSVQLDSVNTKHGTSVTKMPVLYNYFPYLQAVRFFMNGGNTSFANVSITATPTIVVGNIEQEIDQTSKVNLFPNPMIDRLNINGISKSTEVTVLSSLGVEVKSIITNADTSIDVSDLIDGVYLVIVNNEDGSEAFKVIK